MSETVAPKMAPATSTSVLVLGGCEEYLRLKDGAKLMPFSQLFKSKMKLGLIFTLFASLLRTQTAAEPTPRQMDKAASRMMQSDHLPANTPFEDAARGSGSLTSQEQQVEGFSIKGAQIEAAASAVSNNEDYSYSSAFERLTKGKTGDNNTAVPTPTDSMQEPPELWTPQPITEEDLTIEEIAENDEVELEEDIEVPPLNTYLQPEHFEALGSFVDTMRTRYDMTVHNNLLDESQHFSAKVGEQRSSIGKVFNSVLDNDQIGYFQPVQRKHLQRLQLLGFADEELHKRRAHLADAQGLPYVPKKWASQPSSRDIFKLKRGPLINHGFATATYAIRRIFPYKADPSGSSPEKEGALRVFIVKRKKISEALAEEVLQRQCRVWKALPPERSEELAENGHLLYPVAALKMVEDRYKKPAAGSSAEDGKDKEVLSDLLDGKILNLFLLYPRSYECTLKYLIVSRGRTELLTKIAPMKVMISISVQMIYAVAQLNSYGVVHTRIRPTSFVITHDGKVLLTDFFGLVENGTRLACYQQAVPMALDINSSPEEAQCTDRVPGFTYEASLALDSWRLGVVLYKLWCRESWDPASDPKLWEVELERRRRVVQARALDPYKTVQRYDRHKLALKHCRKDTPSFILRLIQQFLEPDPAKRLTSLDAVRGTSLFMHMKRRIQAAQAILESIQKERKREEL